MRTTTMRSAKIGVAILAALATGIYLGRSTDAGNGDVALIRSANAATEQPKFSPVKRLDHLDAYFPGTEDLAPDEMRVIACGTGMPNARPKQAAACFLVELGNGDKFIFDIGSGSFERLSALSIPMDYLDKVFIGHLHSDHMGDLDGLWVGGVIGNRQRPLRIWGPSGAKPEQGTVRPMRSSTCRRCSPGIPPRARAT